MEVSYVYLINGKKQVANTTAMMPPELLIEVRWNFNGTKYRLDFTRKKLSRLLINDKYGYIIVMYYPLTGDNVSVYDFERKVIKQLTLPKLVDEYFVKNNRPSENAKGIYFFGISSIENDEDHICISVCTNIDTGKGELVEDRLFDLRDLEFKNSINVWSA